MDIDRNFQFLNDRPQPIIFGVIERPNPLRVRGDVWQQHTAAEPVTLDPAHISNRFVYVVQEDLTDTSAPIWKTVAPVSKPPIVGPNASEAMLEFVRLRRRREQDEGRKER